MTEQSSGKWLPFNPTGSQHECQKKGPTVAIAPEPTKTLTLEQMDIRLKRVEKVLFKTG